MCVPSALDPKVYGFAGPRPCVSVTPPAGQRFWPHLLTSHPQRKRGAHPAVFGRGEDGSPRAQPTTAEDEMCKVQITVSLGDLCSPDHAAPSRTSGEERGAGTPSSPRPWEPLNPWTSVVPHCYLCSVSSVVTQGHDSCPGQEAACGTCCELSLGCCHRHRHRFCPELGTGPPDTGNRINE